jgi:predicted RNA-binding protein associated with RNAse of E/G family
MAKRKEQSFDDLLEMLQHAAPFSPFSIVLASGDKILIDDPFKMVNTGSVVFYAKSRSELVHHLRKAQIVAIEQFVGKSAA